MNEVFTFWNCLLLSKFNYEDKTQLYNLGRKLLEQGLRQGESLTKQRSIYRMVLQSIFDRKVDDKPIWRSDHEFGLGCMMALIIMKDIPEIDDPTCGLYYPPTAKKNIKSK